MSLKRLPHKIYIFISCILLKNIVFTNLKTKKNITHQVKQTNICHHLLILRLLKKKAGSSSTGSGSTTLYIGSEEYPDPKNWCGSAAWLTVWWKGEMSSICGFPSRRFLHFLLLFFSVMPTNYSSSPWNESWYCRWVRSRKISWERLYKRAYRTEKLEKDSYSIWNVS